VRAKHLVRPHVPHALAWRVRVPRRTSSTNFGTDRLEGAAPAKGVRRIGAE